MRKLFYCLVILFALSFSSNKSYSQRILINENFETSGFNQDSLPVGWFQVDADGTGSPGVEWAVRDSGSSYPGTAVVKSQAYNSRRAATIAWTAGNPEADDWIFTDSVSLIAGDSLVFWMLLGSPFGDFQDSMQVHACSDQDPVLSIQKLATFKSDTGVNVWKEFKLNLSTFAGQRIYLGFRYFESTLGSQGYWCNIDNVLVGNRGSVGINPIGTNIPTEFALNQNYPNPFNPTTKISFDLAKNTNIRLTIINSIGQQVLSIFEGFKPAGSYETNFDGSNLSSGTYYYRIETDYFSETKKMQLIK